MKTNGKGVTTMAQRCIASPGGEESNTVPFPWTMKATCAPTSISPGNSNGHAARTAQTHVHISHGPGGKHLAKTR